MGCDREYHQSHLGMLKRNLYLEFIRGLATSRGFTHVISDFVRISG